MFLPKIKESELPQASVLDDIECLFCRGLLPLPSWFYVLNYRGVMHRSCYVKNLNISSPPFSCAMCESDAIAFAFTGLDAAIEDIEQGGCCYKCWIQAGGLTVMKDAHVGYYLVFPDEMSG